ncbi:MAG: T9SS type A sorting domain-containing protein [Chitinophagaceae bacterium]
MKARFNPGSLRAVTLLVIALLAIADAATYAQLPNCTTGTTMYSIFNNVGGSTTADSMEIRSVNVSTGAVGGLMGGRRYWVRKQSGGGTWYYGSAGLGVDMITNRFYVMTQMSTAMQKDIITINPVTATMTVIGSTPTAPTSLNNYHFVKVAVSPNGYGYAIGVHRDSTGAALTFNPLIRFTTCGAVPTLNCSTIELLGYLPSTGNMYKWLLFNGDIAFDIFGNMYFATAAFERVGTITRYTNARLFRIDASNIPSTAGTGTIPMSFVADYNGLDSTVINGIGLDGGGNMYITTRRFTGVQTNPPGPSNSELYSSPFPGVANLVSPFAPITANFSVADLASCYFPTTILGMNRLQLSYKYESGKVNLKWETGNNRDVLNFELQRSDDGNDFETIASISPAGADQSFATYTHTDPQSGFDKHKFYRIRQVMRSGMRFYSNVVNVSFHNKLGLTSNVRPNPFIDRVEANVWLKTTNAIDVRMTDQSGRTVYTRQFSGKSGDNKLNISGIGRLTPGVYVIELRVQDEVIREKLIRQ